MTINNELKLNNADMNAFGGSRTQTHAAPQQFLEASNRARQRLPRPRPYDSESVAAPIAMILSSPVTSTPLRRAYPALVRCLRWRKRRVQGGTRVSAGE
jgi:hypothetical protein